MSEEEIETKATTIVALTFLGLFTVGSIGYFIGEHVAQERRSGPLDRCADGLDSCRIGLNRCDARLTQLEEFLGVVKKGVPAGVGGK